MTSDTTPAAPSTPGRPGLSFEAYEKAYHELSAPDGSPPSQRQLLKYIGTGSNTTLAKYRRRIAESRLADELPPEAGSVDAELLALVQRLATQMALDEAQVADDRVQEIQSDADQRIRIAETTMEKRLRDTDVLEHRATRAEADLADLRKVCEAKEAALTSEAEAHQKLKEDNAMLTQSISDANRQVATHLGELEQRNKALDVARTAEKVAIQNAKEESAEQQKALDDVRTALSNSEAVHAALVEKKEGLNARLEECTKLIAEQNLERQALQSRLDISLEARNATLVQFDELRIEHETLIRHSSELAGEVQSEKRLAQAASDRFEAIIGDKNTQIEHLQQTVKALSKKSGARK